jgi:hypothetical protein
MKQCVVACETLRNELQYAMETTGKDYPIFWVESGLHNTPSKLKARLQDVLEGLAGIDRVLLCFGTCGNSFLGIKLGAYEAILPRVDDCITLLIGSLQTKNNYNRKNAAYYLTEGWLRGERSIWDEYQYCINKYGEETAKDISADLYGHYRSLGLLNTGINDIAKLTLDTKEIADTFHLNQIVIPASTEYIEELLIGPWSHKRFIVKPPFSEFKFSDLQT